MSVFLGDTRGDSSLPLGGHRGGTQTSRPLIAEGGVLSERVQRDG